MLLSFIRIFIQEFLEQLDIKIPNHFLKTIFFLLMLRFYIVLLVNPTKFDYYDALFIYFLLKNLKKSGQNE